MTTIGKVEEYDLRKKNWTSYMARVRQYFKANGVKPEMYTAILITVIGGEAYDLMTDLCSPKKPEDVEFEALVKLMQGHLEPKPSEIAERYKFRHKKQETQESIAEYVANLKKLAKGCKFGTTLEENLRDQLVFGMKNESIRQRLFAETTLDYKTAYTLAISLEAAEVNAGLMQTSESTMNKIATAKVSRFSSQQGPSAESSHRGANKKPCGHCGKNNHEEVRCFFKQATCHLCKKIGHISFVCTKNNSHTLKFKTNRYNKYVTVDVEDSDSENDSFIYYQESRYNR